MPIETKKEALTKQPDEIFLDTLTIPLLSVPNPDGEKIQRYLGLVAGEGFAEETKSEGRLSNLLKIIEPTPLEDMNLGEAKKAALARMLENAESMGANAVEEVLIDYVSMGGLQGSATIVIATGTAIILGEEGLGESNMDRIIEKIKPSDRQTDKDEIISVEDETTKEIVETDLYTGVDQLPDETNLSILDLDFTPSEDFKELEKRYLAVSIYLEKLNNSFEENIKSKSEIGYNLKLFDKSDYRGMDIMRTKEEIIGKEVVDVNARVIGKVKDVDINFETRTVERLIVGQGGILQSIRSSEDIIIPLHMVIAIGDKILIKGG